MGDRVAVLRGGLLQQFDTPKTLYERPRNIFVAAFIGSPSINLTFADVDAGGTGLIVAGQCVPLARAAEIVGVGRKVVLGIRPEAFAYERDSEHDVALKVMPQLVEFMGSEVLVHFSVNPGESAEQACSGLSRTTRAIARRSIGVTIGKPMVARLDTRCPATAGQEFTLWVSSRTMQLFDAKTGATLSVNASGGASGSHDLLFWRSNRDRGSLAVKRPGCTIIGTVVAKPEKREELYRILMAQVAPTRAEEGCVSYDFHCDKG